MLKVGTFEKPDKIHREYYGQGMIFKDEEAFKYRHDEICYIPELSDTLYSRNNIVDACKGSIEVAEEVFSALDWQHVESLIEDWEINGELVACKNCGKMFFCYDEICCPYCCTEYKETED